MAATTERTLTLSDLRERATLSVEEAADLLGVSIWTVYRMARRGDLPTRPSGTSRVLISGPALRRWLGDLD